MVLGSSGDDWNKGFEKDYRAILALIKQKLFLRLSMKQILCWVHCCF